MPMADEKSHQRVKKLRKTRRERGLTETNVWLPESVRVAIERAVADGLYPSRRVAISTALEEKFLAKTEA
jgi:hypothetical protein